MARSGSGPVLFRLDNTFGDGPPQVGGVDRCVTGQLLQDAELGPKGISLLHRGQALLGQQFDSGEGVIDVNLGHIGF